MAKTGTRAATADKPLNPRQLLFVSEYLKDLNATQAYQRSYGVKRSVAETAGPRLLADVDCVDMGSARAVNASRVGTERYDSPSRGRDGATLMPSTTSLRIR
jgi:hypothetical protein